MNKLYEVDDGSGMYWVVAPSGLRAISLVRSLPDHEDLGDDTVVQEATPRTWARLYTGEDGETCSMRLAFELCREHEQIIAGSEWP